MARRQLSNRNEGSATLGPTRTRIPQQGLVAACVAAVAFLCYYATLVPGLDLGDSASFQTGVGSLTLIPRQAYPLYYGLGSLFVWLHPGEPARALNLASAVYGALAVGLAAWLAARLCESLIAGLGAGLFLGFSYTFWTQAVTAEVYTLHLLIVGAAGLALTAWADRPTVSRLAAVLRGVRARVRQPLEHGAAAAGLYTFSPDAPPRRPGRSAAASDVADGRRHRRARSPPIRVELPRLVDRSRAAGHRSARRSRSSGSTSRKQTGVKPSS